MKRSELIPDLAAVEIDEDKLAQVAKLAEVGMSIAAVTHEIRQPLSALKIALQMAREKSDPGSELIKDLGDALDQAVRIENLVDRTRAFLSPPRGKEDHDISEVVGGAISMMKWQIEGRRRIELEVSLGEGLPSMPLDRSLIEQLVSNLIVNARDALFQQGGGRIVVIVKEGRTGVDLIVADNGPGLDSSIAPKIFTPFFTTKAASNGTGLGLYIVKKVVSEHDAAISLMTSEELGALEMGRLSTGFRVTFLAGSRGEAITTPPPRVAGEEAGGTRRKRALVVDDEKPILSLLVKLLGQEGFDCVAVETGEEALTRLESEDFSLVVTDKNLPGLSGVEVARFARTTRPFMPILLITGYASEDSALEALSIGVSDYVVKPLDLDDFRTRLRKVVGHREQRDTRPLRAIDPRAGEESGKWVGKAALDVSVLLIEEDMSLRGLISDSLAKLGCPVRAMATDKDLEARPAFEVMIARPDVLRRRKDWFADSTDGTLGSIAIMDRSGVDKTIEAIHLGARGILAPPFDESSVTFDFKRMVTRILSELG